MDAIIPLEEKNIFVIINFIVYDMSGDLLKLIGEFPVFTIFLVLLDLLHELTEILVNWNIFYALGFTVVCRPTAFFLTNKICFGPSFPHLVFVLALNKNRIVCRLIIQFHRGE